MNPVFTRDIACCGSVHGVTPGVVGFCRGTKPASHTSVSVGKAIDRLRLGSVTTKTLTRTTEEQLNLFKSLDVPPPRMAKAEAL
ncbi:MAG: hypothetical protein AB2L22_11750 [Syntrophales bacterium]